MATITKSSIQVRLDETLKRDAESVFDHLGMDAPTAIRMFFKQVVATGSIPFPLVVNPYRFSKEEEQEILNTSDPKHEDSDIVAVATTPKETQHFLDSLKK